LNESTTKGEAVFEDESSKTVTFSIAKGNTDYFVSLMPVGDTGGDIPYITSITQEGFTINFNGDQTITVRWFVYE
jgi:hypothetical protein